MEFKRILSLYLLFKIFFFFLVVINNFSYIQNQFDFGRMINQISTFYDLYKYSNFETILVNTNICIFVLFLKSMVFLFIIFVIINLLFNNVNDNINNLLYKIKILLVGIFIIITLYFTIIMMFTYWNIYWDMHWLFTIINKIYIHFCRDNLLLECLFLPKKDFSNISFLILFIINCYNRLGIYGLIIIMIKNIITLIITNWDWNTVLYIWDNIISCIVLIIIYLIFISNIVMNIVNYFWKKD